MGTGGTALMHGALSVLDLGDSMNEIIFLKALSEVIVLEVCKKGDW